jgi:hypothetical protein
MLYCVYYICWLVTCIICSHDLQKKKKEEVYKLLLTTKYKTCKDLISIHFIDIQTKIYITMLLLLLLRSRHNKKLLIVNDCIYKI